MPHAWALCKFHANRRVPQRRVLGGGDPRGPPGPSGLRAGAGPGRGRWRERPSGTSPSSKPGLAPSQSGFCREVAVGEGRCAPRPLPAPLAFPYPVSVVAGERCRVTAAGAIVSRGTLWTGCTPGTARRPPGLKPPAARALSAPSRCHPSNFQVGPWLPPPPLSGPGRAKLVLHLYHRKTVPEQKAPSTGASGKPGEPSPGGGGYDKI